MQEYTRTQLLDFFLQLAHQFRGFKYHQYADYTQLFISNPDFSPKHQTSYIQLYVLNWASYILASICNVWALHISFHVNSIRAETLRCNYLLSLFHFLPEILLAETSE